MEADVIEYDFRKGDHVEWTHGGYQVRSGFIAQIEWPLAHVLGWNEMVPMDGMRLISRPAPKNHVTLDDLARLGSDDPTWLSEVTPESANAIRDAIAGATSRVTTTPSTATRIAAECDALKAMLLAKNAAYGDSAMDPVRVFSKASPSEQIRVRIDDKISRLSRGHAMADESMRDTVRDLIGYLVLLLIVEES